MKIIDLLNKIANGEEVPKKIKYKNVVLSYRIDEKDYIGDNYFLSDLLWDENLGFILNNEVEILEKENKIPENLCGIVNPREGTKIVPNNEELMFKINEIIDYLKSKGE